MVKFNFKKITQLVITMLVILFLVSSHCIAATEIQKSATGMICMSQSLAEASGIQDGLKKYTYGTQLPIVYDSVLQPFSKLKDITSEDIATLKSSLEKLYERGYQFGSSVSEDPQFNQYEFKNLYKIKFEECISQYDLR